MKVSTMKISDYIFLFFISIIVIGSIISYKTIALSDPLKPYEKYFVNEKIEKNINQTSSIKALFLGTSSILITDGKTILLTDGFFTRPSLGTLLLSKIEPDKKTIKDVLKQINVKKIDAIFTLHSHHDHALDSAQVASMSDAYLIGSKSIANLAQNSNLDDKKLKIVTTKKSFNFGEFKVTMIPSKHTSLPFFIDSLVGINKNIEKPITMPTYFTNFKEGNSYSLFIEHPLGNIFINPNTSFTQNQLNNYNADVVFLGIASLGKKTLEFQEQYFNNVVKKLNAKVVIPIHWDDFTKSINQPAKPLNILFDKFNNSMDFLINKTEENGMKLRLLNLFDEIVLY